MFRNQHVQVILLFLTAFVFNGCNAAPKSPSPSATGLAMLDAPPLTLHEIITDVELTTEYDVDDDIPTNKVMRLLATRGNADPQDDFQIVFGPYPGDSTKTVTGKLTYDGTTPVFTIDHGFAYIFFQETHEANRANDVLPVRPKLKAKRVVATIEIPPLWQTRRLTEETVYDFAFCVTSRNDTYDQSFLIKGNDNEIRSSKYNDATKYQKTEKVTEFHKTVNDAVTEHYLKCPPNAICDTDLEACFEVGTIASLARAAGANVP